MIRIRHLLAAAAAVLLPVGLAAQAPQLSDAVREFVAVESPTVVLTHVDVIDGTGGPVIPERTIVITDGRITEIGPTGQVRFPDGAEVVELRGHTVMPGIVGMHNHTFYTTANRRAQANLTAPRLYLASGVTTIRTTGSYHPYAEINLKRAIEAGEMPGPRMHVTGPYITGPTSSYMTGVATPEEARRVVAYWAEEGATWFKFYTRIDRESFRAAVQEAHARGLKFTGHLCSVSFTEAVELGIDNLEHGFFTNTDWDPEKEPDLCPPGALGRLADVEIESDDVRATIRTMVENEVPMTSTLAVYELLLPDRPPLEERTLEALAPEAQAEYLATREAISARAESSEWVPIWEKALAFEKAFHDAGGLLAAGVDPTGNGGALPGFGDQRNYELLLEAGFEPLEALRIMTLNGAIILGEEDEYGSVEVGKRADLVVIEGDPVSRPEEIRNVRLVFRDGIGYDPEALVASVRGRVGID